MGEKGFSTLYNFNRIAISLWNVHISAYYSLIIDSGNISINVLSMLQHPTDLVI